MWAELIGHDTRLSKSKVPPNMRFFKKNIASSFKTLVYCWSLKMRFGDAYRMMNSSPHHIFTVLNTCWMKTLLVHRCIVWFVTQTYRRCTHYDITQVIC